ncbi:response regulator [Azohydromonas aeria]|uniref:response regulator n=1 Tax=Azohydromonas aeria TaxID=2590212 RepID=UPI0012FB16C5|nr:response regulator [Azohydromonas aeria]
MDPQASTLIPPSGPATVPAAPAASDVHAAAPDEAGAAPPAPLPVELEPGDADALARVHEEVARVLEAVPRALHRLRRAGTPAEGDCAGVLQLSVRQLQQCAGALRMAGFTQSAMLPQALAELLQLAAAQPGLPGAAVAEGAEQASAALLGYLRRWRAGQPLSPLVLFPAWNTLRTLSGAERIHPADLWPVPWRWLALPGDERLPPLQPDAAVRGAAEQLTLALMRDARSPAAHKLGNLFAALARGAADGRMATLWALAAAVVEGQSRALLVADVHLKRIAPRLLAQVRRGPQGTADAAAQRLAHDLLFYCAQAGEAAQSGATPRLAAARGAWGLQRHPAVDIEHALPPVPNPALLAQAQRQLATAQALWEATASGTPRPGLEELVTQLAQTLRLLLPQEAPAVEALAQALQRAAALSAPAAEPALEVAQALLALQLLLQEHEIEAPGAQLQRLARRIGQALDGQRAPDEAAPVEPWLSALAQRGAERQAMQALGQALRSTINEAGLQLDALAQAPDDATLHALGQRLQRLQGVLSVLSRPALAASVGSLRAGLPARADEMDAAQVAALAQHLATLDVACDRLALGLAEEATPPAPEAVPGTPDDAAFTTPAPAPAPAPAAAADTSATETAAPAEPLLLQEQPELPHLTEPALPPGTAPAWAAPSGMPDLPELVDVAQPVTLHQPAVEDGRVELASLLKHLDAQGAPMAPSPGFSFPGLAGAAAVPSRVVAAARLGGSGGALHRLEPPAGAEAQRGADALPVAAAAAPLPESGPETGPESESVSAADAGAGAPPDTPAAPAPALDPAGFLDRDEGKATGADPVPDGVLPEAEAVSPAGEPDGDTASAAGPVDDGPIDTALAAHGGFTPEPLSGEDIPADSHAAAGAADASVLPDGWAEEPAAEAEAAADPLEPWPAGVAPAAPDGAIEVDELAPESEPAAAFAPPDGGFTGESGRFEADGADAAPDGGLVSGGETAMGLPEAEAPAAPEPEPDAAQAIELSFDLPPAPDGDFADEAFDLSFDLPAAEAEAEAPAAAPAAASGPVAEAPAPVEDGLDFDLDMGLDFDTAHGVPALEEAPALPGFGTAPAEAATPEGPWKAAALSEPVPEPVPAAEPAAALPPIAMPGLLAPLDGEDRVVGPLRVPESMFDIYLEEAEALSARLHDKLAQWQPPQPLERELVVVTHALQGMADTVGDAALAQLARVLEDAMAPCRRAGYGTPAVAAVLGEGVLRLRAMLAQFAAGTLPAPVEPEFLQRLRSPHAAPAHNPFGPPVALETEAAPADGSGNLGAPGDESLDFGSPLADEAGPAPSVAPAGMEPDPDREAAEATAWTWPEDEAAEPAAPPAAEAVSPEADEAAALAWTWPEDDGAEPAPTPLDEAGDAPVSAPADAVDLADAGETPALPVPETAVPAAGEYPADEADEADDPRTLDAALFPVFEDEAQELLPRLAQALRGWSEEPSGDEHAGAAMRALHTLKGGARLSGAMRLGEAAHRLESDIEDLLMRSGLPRRPDIDMLLERADRLSAAFEQLRPAAAAPDTPPDTAAPAVQSAAAGEADTLPVDAAAEPAPTAPPALPQPLAVAEAEMPAIDWSRFASEAPPLPAAAAAASPAATVRVRAPALDRLVAQAGEVGIARARLTAQLQQLGGSLADLDDNLQRLRAQLREVELQAETQLDSRLEAARQSAQAFDPLEMDRTTRLQELTRMMAESLDDVATVQHGLRQGLRDGDDELVALGRLAAELQDELLRARLVAFDSLAERLQRVLRQAAQEAQRQVRLEIEGGAVEIDRGVLERMAPAFEHLLRNAVAHGIEPPAERFMAGKPAEGRVLLSLSQEGSQVSVSCSDDGRGLDLPRIHRRAIERGLLPLEAQPDAAVLQRLVFAPGFSTAEQLSPLAGRGVGLDVVRAEVEALGGHIALETTPGQGSRFTLQLPLTTAVMQVLLLRCGAATVAVPVALVEEELRVPAAEAARAAARGRFGAGIEAPAFFRLEALLRQPLPPQPGEAAAEAEVLLLRGAQQRLALQVQQVLGRQEAVLKPLGPQLSALPGLAGMSLLPSGTPLPIYNPAALALRHTAALQAAQVAGLGTDLDPAQAEGIGAAGVAGAAAAPPAPLVLVVDDSLTVRRVTQRLLEREGYRVAVAKDGQQALELLAQEQPALVLTDLEMPRLDGFDLLRRLRADARWSAIPVIVITSRLAARHRELAAALGVEHYLGKPYAQDEVLALVARYSGRLQAPSPASTEP